MPLKLVSLFLSSFILWLATSIILWPPHTTLSNTTHYFVVRSGFVVSFVSNLKMKPSGHSFLVWFSNFPFAHKTSFFGLVFRGFPRAHNLVFGRTHYFVFRPHIFRSSTQLDFGPHELLCFSVFFSRTQYFIWWLSISDIYHNIPLKGDMVRSSFPTIIYIY